MGNSHKKDGARDSTGRCAIDGQPTELLTENEVIAHTNLRPAPEQTYGMSSDYYGSPVPLIAATLPSGEPYDYPFQPEPFLSSATSRREHGTYDFQAASVDYAQQGSSPGPFVVTDAAQAPHYKPGTCDSSVDTGTTGMAPLSLVGTKKGERCSTHKASMKAAAAARARGGPSKKPTSAKVIGGQKPPAGGVAKKDAPPPPAKDGKAGAAAQAGSPPDAKAGGPAAGATKAPPAPSEKPAPAGATPGAKGGPAAPAPGAKLPPGEKPTAPGAAGGAKTGGAPPSAAPSAAPNAKTGGAPPSAAPSAAPAAKDEGPSDKADSAPPGPPPGAKDSGPPPATGATKGPAPSSAPPPKGGPPSPGAPATGETKTAPAAPSAAEPPPPAGETKANPPTAKAEAPPPSGAPTDSQLPAGGAKAGAPSDKTTAGAAPPSQAPVPAASPATTTTTDKADTSSDKGTSDKTSEKPTTAGSPAFGSPTSTTTPSVPSVTDTSDAPGKPPAQTLPSPGGPPAAGLSDTSTTAVTTSDLEGKRGIPASKKLCIDGEKSSARISGKASGKDQGTYIAERSRQKIGQPAQSVNFIKDLTTPETQAAIDQTNVAYEEQVITGTYRLVNKYIPGMPGQGPIPLASAAGAFVPATGVLQGSTGGTVAAQGNYFCPEGVQQMCLDGNVAMAEPQQLSISGQQLSVSGGATISQVEERESLHEMSHEVRTGSMPAGGSLATLSLPENPTMSPSAQRLSVECESGKNESPLGGVRLKAGQYFSRAMEMLSGKKQGGSAEHECLDTSEGSVLYVPVKSGTRGTGGTIQYMPVNKSPMSPDTNNPPQNQKPAVDRVPPQPTQFYQEGAPSFHTRRSATDRGSYILPSFPRKSTIPKQNRALSRHSKMQGQKTTEMCQETLPSNPTFYHQAFQAGGASGPRTQTTIVQICDNCGKTGEYRCS